MSKCVKCGRETVDGGDLCADCRNAELVYGDEAEEKGQTSAEFRGSRKFGLKRGIIGAVLSFIALSFASSVIGYAAIVMGVRLGSLADMKGGDGIPYQTIEAVLIALTVICSLISEACLVIGIILGTKSIRGYKGQVKAGYVKPIPTLVLGIAAVALGALSVLLIFSGYVFLIIGLAV